MQLVIRKESFGYLLFDKESREHYFVEHPGILEEISKEELYTFLEKYYGAKVRNQPVEFMRPPLSQLELSAPLGMYLEISRGCNLSCSHCYKPKTGEVEKTGRADIMSISTIQKTLEELRHLGVLEIRLCGNEPTFSPHFFEVCQIIQKLDLYLGINTNAFFEEEIGDKIIALQPNFVVVSIDGSRVTHDELRMPGSYDKALSFLKKLTEHNVSRRINTILSRRTIPEIEHIIRLGSEHGANISFLPFRSIGRPTPYKEECKLTKELMFEAVKKITELRLKYPNITVLTYFNLLDDNAICHHALDWSKPCPARKNGFIACNGDFFPCDFLRYLGDQFKCGNLQETTFTDIWSKSTVLQGFQKLQHSKCPNCRFYMKKCYGGCICGTLASTRSIDDDLCFVDLLPNE